MFPVWKAGMVLTRLVFPILSLRFITCIPETLWIIDLYPKLFPQGTPELLGWKLPA